jgi:1-acyl-sn-glycerol-3-phosphate acyltransferase
MDLVYAGGAWSDGTNADRLTKNQFARLCGLGIMRLYRKVFRLRTDIRGLDHLPPGPRIFAANHPNISDAFQLPLFLPDGLTLIAQASQFRAPILGWIMTHSGQIPVQRANGQEAFDRACATLRQGGDILIFPEGTVNPGDRERCARTGAVRMALATGAPIIPLGIHVASGDTVDLRFCAFGSAHLGRWQYRGRFSVRAGRPWRPGDDPQEERYPRALTRHLMARIHGQVQQAAQEGGSETDTA